MTAGVTGSFDIVGNNNFAARFFYSEQYDKTSGKRVVSITGISIQSTVYGGTWYLGGTVAVEGETLFTMDYVSPNTTNWATVGAAGETWYEVGGTTEAAFPWVSSEIESNADGSKSVTFTVSITLWRNSSSPKPTISGSQTIELSRVAIGAIDIDLGTMYKKAQAQIDNGSKYVHVLPMIDNGESWDIIN